MADKSLLEGMQIKEQGFPLSDKVSHGKSDKLEVVSHCPKCNNPIYGPKQATVGPPINAQRTCSCQMY